MNEEKVIATPSLKKLKKLKKIIKREGTENTKFLTQYLKICLNDFVFSVLKIKVHYHPLINMCFQYLNDSSY